jgi:glycosyltransferase involved in cell wall biosynthesis
LIKNNQIPVSIIIPTLGDPKIIKCLNKINESSHKPSEILVVIPKQNFERAKNIKSKFLKLNIKIILSNKQNQVFQRILGFKKSKYKFVMQLDDDVLLERDCLIKLFKFLKGRKKSSVAPRYTDRVTLSKIYKKPNNRLLKIYHWLINSKKGYDPGGIAKSGFNYSEENRLVGSKKHQWLSGGAVMHHKKNLILYNYYPFKFDKSYCEDILHSLILRKNGIQLFKYFEAKASAEESGRINDKKGLFFILRDFYSELQIRYFIVKKFRLSRARLMIYYLIYFLRIVLKIIK